MDFGGLAVRVSGGDAFSEGLQAAHLCLCSASGMVAAPPFPARTAFFANVAQDCVSRDCGRAVFAPEPPVLADRDDGFGLTLENGDVAAAGVVGPVRCHGTDLLILRDLVEQGRQGRAITLPAGGELDGPDVGCGCIHGQMNLAPFTPARGAVLASMPFAIAEKLDPRTVHQQVQGAVSPAIGDLDGECLLAAAQGRVIRHGPVQPRKLQQCPNHADRLAQRQFEQNLDRQAQLDRHVREHRRPAHLARRLRKPFHLGVDQDQQRPTTLKRAVVLGPVRGTVTGRLWLAHTTRLTLWIRLGNPQTTDFCNNAPGMKSTKAAF